jgi:hypothetical protein
MARMYLRLLGAESLDTRKLILQITGKPIDNPRTPTFCSLPCEDIPADGPI